MIYLCLGSNLNNRQRNISQTIEKLKEKEFIVTKTSSLYETSPWGKTDQSSFLNLVLEGKTTLSPENLLKEIKDIERDLGRIPTEKWGPRTIDIDILFYDEHIINTPLLTIPHPMLHQRAFVLIPLKEIAPDFLHPVLKKTVRELYEGLTQYDDKDTVIMYNTAEEGK